jgi:hypothetical protein
MEQKPAEAPAALNIPDIWNSPQLQAVLRQVIIAILEQILAALKAA